jgi:hypothetical protein
MNYYVHRLLSVVLVCKFQLTAVHRCCIDRLQSSSPSDVISIPSCISADQKHYDGFHLAELLLLVNKVVRTIQQGEKSSVRGTVSHLL